MEMKVEVHLTGESQEKLESLQEQNITNLSVFKENFKRKRTFSRLVQTPSKP